MKSLNCNFAEQLSGITAKITISSNKSADLRNILMLFSAFKFVIFVYLCIPEFRGIAPLMTDVCD